MGLAISAVLLAVVAVAPLAAQSAPHVEVSALAADIAMRPVYLKPIAPLTRQPSAPAQLDTSVHMPAFGVAASVYVSARVHGIVQWSRSTNRRPSTRPDASRRESVSASGSDCAVRCG